MESAEPRAEEEIEEVLVYPTYQTVTGGPELRRSATLIGTGWLVTGLAIGITGLPLTFLLKDGMGLMPHEIARFMFVANIPIYIKPLAGILSDAVPFFGTRRKHYLVYSLLMGGLFWLLLGLVPSRYTPLLVTYFLLNLFLVMTSTVLGGLMVDVGQRYHATGRMSAQRVGITRALSLVTGPVGGFLASRPFFGTVQISAVLHFLLAPVFWLFLREEPGQQTDTGRLAEVWRQFKALFQSGTLWSAAGLVVLVIISPGFGTPMLFYQTNTLGFSKQFIGNLAVIGGVCSLLAAVLYGLVCRRWNLRTLLAVSILIHALGTLFYLAYRSHASALWITALEGVTQTLAVLPLYDLAARATPRGSEALGYSLMMSVWNLTNALSDLLGSWLFDHFRMTFHSLVWLNAGTTALILLAVPLLPAVLMRRRDGERQSA